LVRTVLQADLDSENQRFPESVKENDSWITPLTRGFNRLFLRLIGARISRTSADGFPAQTCRSCRQYSPPPGGRPRARPTPSPGLAIPRGGTAAAPGAARTIR